MPRASILLVILSCLVCPTLSARPANESTAPTTAQDQEAENQEVENQEAENREAENQGTKAPNATAETGIDQKTTDDEAVHQQLIAVREAIVKAVNSEDLDALLVHVHPDVVAVWQDGEISRGREGVRKYYESKLGGPDAVLDSYTLTPQVQERTALYGGDMGIAYGSVLCHFKFKDGREFDLDGPFSATLVVNEGAWQIVSFHASSGLFKNPLLLMTQRWLVWASIGAGVAGLAIGAIVMSVIKRRKPA